MSYKHEDDSGLLPCPFCGGEAEVYEMQYGENGKYSVFGVFCVDDSKAELIGLSKYQHGHFIDNFRTEAEAVEAWNNRAQTVFGLTLDEVRQMIKRDAERERTCENVDTDDDCYFECSKCGSATLVEYKSGGYGVPNFCPNCGAKVVS